MKTLLSNYPRQYRKSRTGNIPHAKKTKVQTNNLVQIPSSRAKIRRTHRGRVQIREPTSQYGKSYETYESHYVPELRGGGFISDRCNFENQPQNTFVIPQIQKDLQDDELALAFQSFRFLVFWLLLSPLEIYLNRTLKANVQPPFPFRLPRGIG